MELTGIAVLASLAMAAGAVCVFIYAVKRTISGTYGPNARFAIGKPEDFPPGTRISRDVERAGVLSPIFAAAAMVLSSLSVIGNSRRLG